MKDLKDYKRTETLIEIHSNEEYVKMVPLLNQVFKNWLPEKVYFQNGGYVDMDRDLVVDYNEFKGNKLKYKILQASEFLDQQENNITIEEFKKDNYYHLDLGSKSYILKFIKFDGNSIVADNLKYKDGVHFYKGGYFSKIEAKNFRLANLEEIQWLDVCIQENKFIPKDQISNYSPITTKKEEIMEEKWKVGGWIKVISNGKYNGEEYKIGEFYQITKYSHPHVYVSINSQNVLLCTEKTTYYPPECEWIGIADISTEQPKFEIGKWYKVKAYGLDYIIKYEQSLDKIQHLLNNRYYTTGDFRNGNLKFVSNVDLSEIQQYLPEGHIDKIKTHNMEKGKYYSCSYTWDTRLWYFQFDRIESGNLYYTWCKNYEGTILYNNYILYSAFKNFKEVTEQEAKGIQEENLVGRYVKCLQNTCEIKKGGYLKILNIYESANGKKQINYEKYGTGSYPVNKEYWELMPIGFNPESLKEDSLLEQAKLKYKKGDKVKSPQCNQEFTIGEYDGQSFYDGCDNTILAYKKEFYGVGEYVYYEGKWAEILKQEETIPEYVECIRYTSTNNEYIVGKIYKVENRKVRTEQGFLGMQELPTSLLNHYGNTDFKKSSKEAYGLQQGVKTWQEYTTTKFNESYTIGIDPYKMDVIEVGDEIQYCGRDKYLILSENPTRLRGIGDIHEDDYSMSLKEINESKSWKLIKKGNAQTTITHKKPDISLAIQVGNEITNIIIPKSASVVLKNTENEVKIKINQTQTIKL